MSTATNKDLEIEIQSQLEEVEREIHECSEKVSEWESKANDLADKLGQLDKEGQYCRVSTIASSPGHS